MSVRAGLAAFLAIWAGSALVLAELSWFRRTALSARLGPYSPSIAVSRSGRVGVSTDSFREVAAPLARSLGEWVSGVLGIDEDLGVRLERIHSPIDPSSFRLRQLGWSTTTLALGALASVAAGPPPPVAALLLIGAPTLAFLLPEHQLSAAGAARDRRVFLELAVVAEQLGMLLSAGYSLGTALNRLAERGTGACSEDLRRVGARVRYGATEIDALHDWARVARVPAVERLVTVLSLNREAGDLGRLISEEARSIRRDAQRELVETIERKSQLVWVPVTVAALIPGTLFIVVPFVEAMRLFTRS